MFTSKLLKGRDFWARILLMFAGGAFAGTLFRLHKRLAAASLIVMYSIGQQEYSNTRS